MVGSVLPGGKDQGEWVVECYPTVERIIIMVGTGKDKTEVDLKV